MDTDVIITLFSIWALTMVFTITQFLDLMSRPDDDFPGRHDKLIWVFVIFSLNFLGAILYWSAKPVKIPESNRLLRDALREEGRQ